VHDAVTQLLRLLDEEVELECLYQMQDTKFLMLLTTVLMHKERRTCSNITHSDPASASASASASAYLNRDRILTSDALWQLVHERGIRVFFLL
jgi:hypothetical protein